MSQGHYVVLSCKTLAWVAAVTLLSVAGYKFVASVVATGQRIRAAETRIDALQQLRRYETEPADQAAYEWAKRARRDFPELEAMFKEAWDDGKLTRGEIESLMGATEAVIRMRADRP